MFTLFLRTYFLFEGNSQLNFKKKQTDFYEHESRHIISQDRKKSEKMAHVLQRNLEKMYLATNV